jgi:hypothetical protein
MTTTADCFHDLHAGSDVLVLPNAWDAASAALMEDAGAKAVATSSAAVAWARGYADGDALPVAALIDVIAGIARVIKVPLTADIEGGYTDDLGELAETDQGGGRRRAPWGSTSRTAAATRTCTPARSTARAAEPGRREPVHQRPHRRLSGGPGGARRPWSRPCAARRSTPRPAPAGSSCPCRSRKMC